MAWEPPRWRRSSSLSSRRREWWERALACGCASSSLLRTAVLFGFGRIVKGLAEERRFPLCFQETLRCQRTAKRSWLLVYSDFIGPDGGGSSLSKSLQIPLFVMEKIL